VFQEGILQLREGRTNGKRGRLGDERESGAKCKNASVWNEVSEHFTLGRKEVVETRSSVTTRLVSPTRPDDEGGPQGGKRGEKRGT